MQMFKITFLLAMLFTISFQPLYANETLDKTQETLSEFFNKAKEVTVEATDKLLEKGAEVGTDIKERGKEVGTDIMDKTEGVRGKASDFFKQGMDKLKQCDPEKEACPEEATKP